MGDILDLRNRIIELRRELQEAEDQWRYLRPPHLLNVIFVSMRRHGISWIIRTLSALHEVQFGVPIEFTPKNAEIDTLKATRNRFELPKGWNCVYDVPVKQLLEKKDPQGLQYDRVVLIQRDYDQYIEDLKVYYKAQNVAQFYVDKIMSEIPHEYEKLYGIDDPLDPRFIRVSLEDLNNRTLATFTKLMDHLGFPKECRGVPVAVRNDDPDNPIKRNWQKYSTELREDEDLCKILKRVEDQ